MTNTKPQFSVAELIKAAELAGIDPASLPATANPWTLSGDSRAFAWQSAFRALNPSMAQDVEVSFGPPLGKRVDRGVGLLAVLPGLQVKVFPVVRNAVFLEIPARHRCPAAGTAIEGESH